MSTDRKLIGAAIILLVLIAIVTAAGKYRSTANMPGDYKNDGGGTVCTDDAMQCPDGSYVGRTGPDCRFVCAPGNSSGSSSTSTQGSTGSTAGQAGGTSGLLTGELVGTVTIGPTCPVVQNPPSGSCADRPYQTFVTVSTGSREVGREMTDREGRFAFSFLPGTYTVAAEGGTPLPRCGSETTTLTKAATTTVALTCDSGIR